MRPNWRALFYYGVASVNVFSSLLPVWPGRFDILKQWLRFPLPVILGAQDVTLLAGLAMLLLAYPAARGARRCAHLLMACALLAILSNLVKGLDVEEALLDALLLWSLWRGRRSFATVPLRYTLVDAARLLFAVIVLGKLYLWLGGAMLATLHALVAEPIETTAPIRHLTWLLTAKLDVQNLWFQQSREIVPLFLVAVFVGISATSVLRATDMGGDADFYARFGRASHNSLAYLSHRADVNTFVDPRGRGAISYRTVGRVALQIGAILAPAEARADVYNAFCAYCRAQHLTPASIALSVDEAPAALAARMHVLTLGTEALVDLPDFDVAKLNKKMRWAQRSLAKRGFTVEVLSAAAVSPALQGRLAHLDAEWRYSRGGQDHGCCMTLGRFPTTEEAECVVGLMRDAAHVVVAYVTLLPGGEGYYSLDLTRRALDAPNAAMEFLLTGVLTHLRERGARQVSLNFSTLSWLETSPLGTRALDAFSRAFQLRTLEAFNNKFQPSWQPRYLAFPSWATLPDVIYAMLRLEGVDRMAVNAVARGLRRHTRSLVLPSGEGRAAVTVGSGEGD